MEPLTAADRYTIRPLVSLDDLEACFRLQQEVWGRGFGESAPVSILKVSQRLGGLVGGAVDPSGELVGFVFGITGIEAGRPVHWSHMLAVRPGFRDGGLGRRLKAWQRERCRELGIRRMYWTFDPLESRNGWLNFGRLGVVSREYVEDMYGRSDSPIHEGLGTDRLVALWLLDSLRVEERVAGTGAPPVWKDVCGLPCVVPVTERAGLPRPGPPTATGAAGADGVLVPVPADIQEVKASDAELALSWRLATRAAFTSWLGRGWEVRELVRTAGSVSYYVLRPTGAPRPADPGAPTGGGGAG